MERNLLIELGFKEVENDLPETANKPYEYTAKHGGKFYIDVSPNGWVKGWNRSVWAPGLWEMAKEKFPTNGDLSNFYEALEYFITGGEIERAVKMFETFNTNEMNRWLRDRE